MNAPVVVSKSGPLRLGHLLAKGGEGAVYDVVGRPEVVAKIYLKDVSPQRADKLLAMETLQSPRLASLTAWPTEILRTQRGSVAGFLMPFLRGSKDIHNLYGPRSRLSEFPQADWRMLVRAAANTARAFAVLHDSNCLVGDVNHGGIRVSTDATVKLIDCDSFQIHANGKTFVCEVGVEDFTPPELQGVSFRTVLRTTNHDNFGLAVMVFRLLMMGRHPFAGRYSGPGDMSIPRAVGEFRYAYARDKSATRMEQPPHTPSVSIVGEEIAGMWERAYGRQGVVPGGRPTAEQWVRALANLESRFVKCAQHSNHYYLRGTANCPWCPIERTGVALFGLASGPLPAFAGPFNLDSIWLQIMAVRSPGQAPNVLVPSLSPSPEAETLRSSRSSGAGIGVAVGATIFVLASFLAPKLWIVWAPIAWFIGQAVAAANERSVDLRPFIERQYAAQKNYDDLEKRWKAEASTASFDQRLSKLQQLRQEWLGLSSTRQRRYAELAANIERNARRKFLDNFEIDRAVISGIGPAKKSMLESYGIETAADVTYSKVSQVPGFGPALTKKMVGWRNDLEKRFVFDPRTGVDPRDVADMDRSLQQRKSELETELRAGAASLQQIVATISARRRALGGAMKQAATDLGQARADVQALR